MPPSTPARQRSRGPGEGLRPRTCTTPLDRVVEGAARRSRLAKRATRHAFPTRFVEGGRDIGTVLDLPGHRGVSTMVISMAQPHVLARSLAGVGSPADRMGGLQCPGLRTPG